jgi:hypothetical protein
MSSFFSLDLKGEIQKYHKRSHIKTEVTTRYTQNDYGGRFSGKKASALTM